MRRVTLIVLLSALVGLPGVHTASAVDPCGRTPLDPPVEAKTNLDVPASAYGIFCDGGTPTWAIGNVSAPSLDGNSLKVSLTGGTPYSGVHAYRTLPAQASLSHLDLDVRFRLPPDTCNNATAPSTVQAVEFTSSKWSGGLRWESAVQYRNVGEGAPGWRYWDPSAEGDRWVPLQIGGCLPGTTWHRVRITSTILDGELLRYDTLLVNGASYPLNIMVGPAAAPDFPDSVGIAMQLDANSTATPFDVYFDRIMFNR